MWSNEEEIQRQRHRSFLLLISPSHHLSLPSSPCLSPSVPSLPLCLFWVFAVKPAGVSIPPWAVGSSPIPLFASWSVAETMISVAQAVHWACLYSAEIQSPLPNQQLRLASNLRPLRLNPVFYEIKPGRCQRLCEHQVDVTAWTNFVMWAALWLTVFTLYLQSLFTHGSFILFNFCCYRRCFAPKSALTWDKFTGELVMCVNNMTHTDGLTLTVCLCTFTFPAIAEYRHIG